MKDKAKFKRVTWRIAEQRLGYCRKTIQMAIYDVMANRHPGKNSRQIDAILKSEGMETTINGIRIRITRCGFASRRGLTFRIYLAE